MAIFMTGGTGYVGQRLATALIAKGHRVRVPTRPLSVSRVVAGAERSWAMRSTPRHMHPR